MRFPTWLLVITAFAGCTAEFPHKSPFDPKSSAADQARASIDGLITLEGETDYGQVTIELQNAEHTYLGSSRSDGSYSLTGVVPGEYAVRFTARHFEEVEEPVEVTLGEKADFGLRELALKRAAVTGKASAIRNQVEVGGLFVKLLRSAGIRGAAGDAAPRWRPGFVWMNEVESEVVLNTVSGADGTFRIEGVPAGVYDVTIAGGSGGNGFVGKVTITGEEAVVTLDPVTLDESGPAVPDLAIADHDGDGFGLDAEHIELTWSRPSDADLAGFQLERYVRGTDVAFRPIASFGAAAGKFTDWVTQSTGRKHIYRIRSVDQTGNASDWSLVAEAEPFRGIDEVFWLRSVDGVNYFFPVQTGTDSLSSVYFYKSGTRSLFTTALANNVPEWLRPASFTSNWEEKVTLRAANQTNTLAYESTFNLGINQRSLAAYDNDGAYLGYGCAVATDPFGRPYVIYSSGFGEGLFLATEEDGKWSSITIDGTAGTVLDVEAAWFDGALHVVYNVGNGIRYATNESGAWVVSPDQVTTYNVGRLDASVDSGGRLHIAAMVSVGGVISLRYFRLTGGVVDINELIETTGTGSIAPGLGIGPDGSIHVVYYENVGKDLKYAKRTGANTWATELLDDVGNVGSYPSIAISSDYLIHVAYLTGWDSGEELRYVGRNGYSGAGWPAPQTIFTQAPVSKFTATAATQEGDPMIFFTTRTDSKLFLARKNGFNWESEQVETTINQNYAHSMRAVTDNRNRVHVVYMHEDERNVRHLMASGKELAEHRLAIAARGYYLNMAAGATGETHFVYGHRWDNKLIYYTNRSGTMTGSELVWGTQKGAIAVSRDGVVHTAYANPALRYSYDSGAGFVEELIDATDINDHYALGLLPSGAPALAYVDGTASPSRLKYVERTGSGWGDPVTVGTLDADKFQTPRVGAAAGVTAVAATRKFTGYFDVGVYVKEEAQWTDLEFAPPVTAVYLKALAVHPDGSIHVAFQDYREFDFWYAAYEAGAWSYRLLESAGDAGHHAKILIDKRGYVLLFYAGAGDDLHFATDIGGWNVKKVIDEPYGLKRFSVAMDWDSNLHAATYRGDFIYAMPFIGGRKAATESGRVSGW